MIADADVIGVDVIAWRREDLLESSLSNLGHVVEVVIDAGPIAAVEERVFGGTDAFDLDAGHSAEDCRNTLETLLEGSRHPTIPFLVVDTGIRARAEDFLNPVENRCGHIEAGRVDVLAVDLDDDVMAPLLRVPARCLTSLIPVGDVVQEFASASPVVAGEVLRERGLTVLADHFRGIELGCRRIVSKAVLERLIDPRRERREDCLQLVACLGVRIPWLDPKQANHPSISHDRRAVTANLPDAMYEVVSGVLLGDRMLSFLSEVANGGAHFVESSRGVVSPTRKHRADCCRWQPDCRERNDEVVCSHS
ncbi:hypothetical protein [Haloterrigena salinisoli]|uniref:hypothetical protein n=1 Tax=Haloterrigena salinisoli TaxID=3132747 RepID=UPI0030CD7F87